MEKHTKSWWNKNKRKDEIIEIMLEEQEKFESEVKSLKAEKNDLNSKVKRAEAHISKSASNAERCSQKIGELNSNRRRLEEENDKLVSMNRKTQQALKGAEKQINALTKKTKNMEAAHKAIEKSYGIDKAKAHVYDMIVQRSQYENAVRQIDAAIAKKEKEISDISKKQKESEAGNNKNNPQITGIKRQ